jgi:hypothetical protein
MTATSARPSRTPVPCLRDTAADTVKTNEPPTGKVPEMSIDHIRSYVERHPEEAGLYGMTVDEVLELFPRRSVPTDLETSLRAFMGDASHRHVMVAAYGDGDERPNNRMHNLAHRLGWKHG